jgi:hypothetical protein
MIQYFYNGKPVQKTEIPKEAKRYHTVNQEYYGSVEYLKEQGKKAQDYFAKQAEYREELEKRHG